VGIYGVTCTKFGICPYLCCVTPTSRKQRQSLIGSKLEVTIVTTLPPKKITIILGVCFEAVCTWVKLDMLSNGSLIGSLIS
jgi:hypothetical protein